MLKLLLPIALVAAVTIVFASYVGHAAKGMLMSLPL